MDRIPEINREKEFKLRLEILEKENDLLRLRLDLSDNKVANFQITIDLINDRLSKIESLRSQRLS